jgi:hypothetical protein
MSTPGFWKRNWEDNRVVITDSHAVVNRIWYLFPQGGGPRGAFATFETLKPHLRSRDVIYLSGVLEEAGAVTPENIFDVTIIGAANRPRQATSSGTPTGGGAYWKTDGRTLASLLEIRSAGWMLQNICFNPAGTYSCVKLTRSATVDLTDASHAIIDNCYFVGGGQGQIGIENSGGAGFCRVSNSRFLLLDAAIKCTSTAAAIPLLWEIVENSFSRNTNDIASSLSYAQILRNRFMTAGAGAVNKVISTTYNAVQGGNNQVLLNHFNNPEAEIAPATGYTGAASDFWSNYVTDQAALAIGQPA